MAGGVRKHIEQLIEHFSSADPGWQVSALLGDRGEPGFDRYVRGLNERGVCAEIIPHFQRELRPGSDWNVYQAVKRRLREIEPDIVHTHSAKAGFIGRLAAHSVGIPRIIHTPHVFPFQWSTGIRRRFYLALERHAAKRCHKIVCVADGQREAAREADLTETGKLEVILNGVRPSECLAQEMDQAAIRKKNGFSDSDAVVGMVARMAPQKGVGIFLRAAACLLQRRPSTQFVLVGGGSQIESLRKRAYGLGIPKDKILFMGHVENANDVYPAFEVVVLSSLYEGLPYVLLESMSWGLPVVATDVLGSSEVVEEGKTGYLVPIADPIAMASRIEDLLNDRASALRMGKAARERVKSTYSLETFLNGHRKLYLSHEKSEK